MPRILKYTDAIREATDQMMALDPKIFVIGEGVTYKNGADGTTAGLVDRYSERVLDVPNSEAGFTGLAVGAAISGLHPIVHYGRVEFSLLAADQIITQAANWNFMMGGNNPVPIVFRINVGRQWGNGPQHTAAHYSLFGSVPGLNVVIPSTPYMAKGLLVSALKENCPVVIMEPRWCFNVKEDVPEITYQVPLDKARIVKEGSDITVVAYGDGLIAAIEALPLIVDDVSVELIDLVSLNPIDHSTIGMSIAKTGQLLCVDTTTSAFGIASEIICRNGPGLKTYSICCHNHPCPTSPALSGAYYPTKWDIANSVLDILGWEQVARGAADYPTFAELHIAPTLTIGAL